MKLCPMNINFFRAGGDSGPVTLATSKDAKDRATMFNDHMATATAHYGVEGLMALLNRVMLPPAMELLTKQGLDGHSIQSSLPEFIPKPQHKSWTDIYIPHCGNECERCFFGLPSLDPAWQHPPVPTYRQHCRCPSW